MNYYLCKIIVLSTALLYFLSKQEIWKISFILFHFVIRPSRCLYSYVTANFKSVLILYLF